MAEPLSPSGSSGEPGPDLQEIRKILDVVEHRDPESAGPERLDADHGVLLTVQAELGEAVTRQRVLDPAARPAADELRLLLDRVENVLAENRSARARLA
jgi:hypothetical protein